MLGSHGASLKLLCSGAHLETVINVHCFDSISVGIVKAIAVNCHSSQKIARALASLAFNLTGFGAVVLTKSLLELSRVSG